MQSLGRFTPLLLCGLLSLSSSTLAQSVNQKSHKPKTVTSQSDIQTKNTMAQQTLTSNTNLTPEEQTLFNNHIKDFISLTPTRIVNDKLSLVFSPTFYAVAIKIALKDGSISQNAIFTQVDDKLITLPSPITNESMSELLSLIKPDFTLTTMDDAKKLQEALNILYPVRADVPSNDSILQNGNTWTLITGKFFDKRKGFIIATGPDGKITSIDYSLNIAPAPLPISTPALPQINAPAIPQITTAPATVTQ